MKINENEKSFTKGAVLHDMAIDQSNDLSHFPDCQDNTQIRHFIKIGWIGWVGSDI